MNASILHNQSYSASSLCFHDSLKKHAVSCFMKRHRLYHLLDYPRLLRQYDLLRNNIFIRVCA